MAFAQIRGMVEGLSNMMAAVQKFGWIDQASQSIRAHIEYAP